MVRRLVLGARRYRVEVSLFLVLAGLVALTVAFRQSAEAAYSTPLWTNATPSQESLIPDVAALAMTPEGMDVTEAIPRVVGSVRHGAQHVWREGSTCRRHFISAQRHATERTGVARTSSRLA